MSDARARLVLAAAVAALVAGCAALDLPRLAQGRFWGDGATYYCMASSLAQDHDLQYETRDLVRAKREFAQGPQGLFLKRASGGLAADARFPWLRRVPESEPRLYFAKPFAYAFAAAPLVWVFGTRGLLLANALALAAALVAGYVELRRRATPGRALAASLTLFLAGVAPLYLLWPTPELFNLALVAVGLVAWSGGRPIVSAILLGIAIYSKPYNLWLAMPLGLAPLLPASGARFGARLVEAVRRAAVCATVVVALFGLNRTLTGEWNYQGGAERKTFYGQFPGETETLPDGTVREVTFGNAGTWMSVNRLGPRVAGEAAPPAEQGAEPPRSAEELRASFVANLGYFWIGRFGGALPYFFPFVAALVLFALGPRDARAWLALAALAVSVLFYVVMIPDQWYGGSGTIGNRYFLNLLPLGLFLLPRGRERQFVASGVVGAAAFMWPIVSQPVRSALQPGFHTTAAPFRFLPAELTMLNDLSIFEETWRKKQPVGDTEGDRWRNWPADPKAYYLYFPDDGTYGREAGTGGPGFWLRGGRSAEVFLRALEPVTRMTFAVSGGPVGDDVAIRVGSARVDASVGPGETRTVALEPAPGFVYKDSFVYVVRLTSARGAPASHDDPRVVGAFVRASLQVRKRPRQPGR